MKNGMADQVEGLHGGKEDLRQGPELHRFEERQCGHRGQSQRGGHRHFENEKRDQNGENEQPDESCHERLLPDE